MDDNVDAAHSLCMLMELNGHTAHVAHDGPQALRAAQALSPDIVFLDIGLPGMNGYEVAQHLRGLPNTRQPMLVALTGWGAREDRERSKQAGFHHHLTKPAEMQAILQLLSRLREHRDVERDTDRVSP